MYRGVDSLKEIQFQGYLSFEVLPLPDLERASRMGHRERPCVRESQTAPGVKEDTPAPQSAGTLDRCQTELGALVTVGTSVQESSALSSPRTDMVTLPKG